MGCFLHNLLLPPGLASSSVSFLSPTCSPLPSPLLLPFPLSPVPPLLPPPLSLPPHRSTSSSPSLSLLPLFLSSPSSPSLPLPLLPSPFFPHHLLPLSSSAFPPPFPSFLLSHFFLLPFTFPTLLFSVSPPLFLFPSVGLDRLCSYIGVSPSCS